jgi:hypothetical protein
MKTNKRPRPSAPKAVPQGEVIYYRSLKEERDAKRATLTCVVYIEECDAKGFRAERGDILLCTRKDGTHQLAKCLSFESKGCGTSFTVDAPNLKEIAGVAGRVLLISPAKAIDGSASRE